MTNEKLFSNFYCTDNDRYEDKPKFRARLLKYLEDFVNTGFSCETYRLCRSELGIDIKRPQMQGKHGKHYQYVEKTFESLEISNILDFLTVVYDSVKPGFEQIGDTKKLRNYLENINKIFREESMCYAINENGRVRYYPDEEFHKTIKSTLILLNKSKYASYLRMFNEILDNFYKNRDKESPIRGLFDCIETFVLSIINDKKFNKLDKDLINNFMQMIVGSTQTNSLYSEEDKNIVLIHINEQFLKWVKMCHKYRHGKIDQVNNNVPKEIFNYLFSSGVSIFRFLIELDDRNNIK